MDGTNTEMPTALRADFGNTAPATDALQTAFDQLHAASRTGNAVDYATRQDRLARLHKLIVENDEQIIAAIDADFGGRVHDETRMLELVPLANALRHTRKHLKRWMRPQRRHVSVVFQPGSAHQQAQPLGLVGIMAPWNYPVYLTIGPLIDVLAAGNRALIKPSELGPEFSALLQTLIAKTFTPDEVQVITGGVDVAQAFSKLPFDHLVFTGSTAVGRKVAMAAAANLTPVTLELGGKSPAIVAPGADLSKAARSVAFGKFANAGQTCIAPDHVWVPRAELKAFTDALVGHIRKSYPDLSSGYTSIATQPHFERHLALLDEITDRDSIIQIGEDDPQARRLAPRIVIDPPNDTRMMQEEIFGPILPILPYDNLDEALDRTNQGERPLALYCFSKDASESRRVVEETIAGGVTVDGTLLHIAQDSLPFGGVGSSGQGVYHGVEGFKQFSHMKPVFKVGFFNPFENMGPPWGKLARMSYRFLNR